MTVDLFTEQFEYSRWNPIRIPDYTKKIAKKFTDICLLSEFESNWFASIAFFVENNLFEWSSFTWAYIWEKMICKVYCAWSLPFRFLQDVDYCIRWVFFLFLKSSLSPTRLHLQPLLSKWDFYNKDWPITLSLKMRISVTRKWFIVCQLSQFLDWQKQNGKLSNHDLILALRVETN